MLNICFMPQATILIFSVPIHLMFSMIPWGKLHYYSVLKLKRHRIIKLLAYWHSEFRLRHCGFRVFFLHYLFKICIFFFFSFTVKSELEKEEKERERKISHQLVYSQVSLMAGAGQTRSRASWNNVREITWKKVCNFLRT